MAFDGNGRRKMELSLNNVVILFDNIYIYTFYWWHHVYYFTWKIFDIYGNWICIYYNVYECCYSSKCFFLLTILLRNKTTVGIGTKLASFGKEKWFISCSN